MSACFQAWMGNANEDKQAAVTRTLCFALCSIILPREEFRALRTSVPPDGKDPHQSCPLNCNAIGPQCRSGP